MELDLQSLFGLWRYWSAKIDDISLVTPWVMALSHYSKTHEILSCLFPRLPYFMSFCRILSTLCSQVVFHYIPHLGKRAGQKVQRKIAVAVQNVKPLYFLSRSFALSPQKSAELFYMF